MDLLGSHLDYLKNLKKSGITAFISTLPISSCQHATVDKQLARIFDLFYS